MNLNIREDKTRGIYIQDVTESYVSDENDVYELMKLGNSNRAIAATNMNEGYAREFPIFFPYPSRLLLSDCSSIEIAAGTGLGAPPLICIVASRGQ